METDDNEFPSTSVIVPKSGPLRLTPTIDFQDITIGQLLADGNYGVVYAVRVASRSQEEDMALKLAKPTDTANRHLENEINILKNMDSQRVVRFVANVVHQNEHLKSFIMERMNLGSLHDFINTTKNSPTLQKTFHDQWFWADLCKQLADAVHYLHVEKKLIHGDINPKNILLSFNNNICHLKIGDFGTSFAIGDPFRIYGTPLYSSPEVFYGFICTTASDIFSFAMTCYFIMYQMEPLLQLNESHSNCAQRMHAGLCLPEELQNPKKPPERPSLNTQDESRTDIEKKIDIIIEAAWNHDPENRPSIEGILKIMESMYNCS